MIDALWALRDRYELYTGRISALISVLIGRWRWRKAHSLADLANLQAERLTRRFAKLPVDDFGPTWNMHRALVNLCQAGFLVHDWRPGTYRRHELATLETRACVTGFADDETKDWLDELLYEAGLEPGAVKYELTHVFELYAEGCEEWDRSGGDDTYRAAGRAWVERIDGVSTHRLGEQMRPDQVYRAFPTNADVEGELQEAWQVTIAAPTWGNPRMWTDLLRLLVENRRPAIA